MKYLVLVLFGLLAVIAGMTARQHPRWHLVEGQANRAEYGIPYSGNRLLTVACDVPGAITLWGPISDSGRGFSEGLPIQVSLRAGSHIQHLNGFMKEADSGYDFSVQLNLKSPFLAYLASGRTIEISHPTGSYEVPGYGGEHVLRTIFAAC